METLRLTRFAPAPTGYLHLGHVANAAAVWRMAASHGARVLLRLEDHDAQRCRPEYETAILDDLDWLGFVPDVFPTSAFRAGPCASRQSDRQEIYAAHARTLVDAGLVYGCRCSRRDVAAASASVAGAVAGADEEPRYPGTCRDLGLAPAADLTWRLRIEPGDETFDDLLLGPQTQAPDTQCGDMAIRDRLGNWTYQFVASLDDHLQGIDLVVRGVDLLSSTGRQMRLARLLGRRTPARFAHHALVMKSAAQKLSKSDGDSGVRDLRTLGWPPERVIEEASARISAAGTMFR
jgi:glutamyl-tRNA synthetase/glutamyl-Q tRNA(Asp) synthetase